MAEEEILETLKQMIIVAREEGCLSSRRSLIDAYNVIKARNPDDPF